MSTNIIETISSTPKERVAFISENKTIYYGDIKKIYDDNKEIISSLQGRNIAIVAKSNEDIAILLCTIDGTVNNILFLPEDINDNLVKKYYKDVNIDTEISLINSKLVATNIKQSHSINQNRVTKWIIPTSGTTKAPKLVSHTLESLTKSTICDTDIGKNYIWGLVFDIKRFSGLQVFLQSLLGGSTLLIPKENSTTLSMLDFFVKNNCNILSATPSFFRKLLMSKEANSLKLRRITLGGEIVSSQILSAIKNKFKMAKITQIYASTEAGVGFSVTDKQSGFPISYLDEGTLTDVILFINNNQLLIKPNVKSQRYIANEKIFDENGFIETGDLVEIRGERVHFLGRESGAINVGGNKVQPEEVEEVLLNSGLINSVYVYAKNSPIMGSLIYADIVPIDDKIDSKLLKMEVINYSKEHLDSFKVPAIIKILKELPITQSGKLKRS